MSAVPSEGVLSQRQTQLLDELSVACGSNNNASASVAASSAAAAAAAAAKGSALAPCDLEGEDYEAFYRHWRRVEAQHRLLEEGQQRGRWEWIEQVQEMCGKACDDLGGLLGHLSELDLQRSEVVRKTTQLHEECEHMVQDQERLSASVEAMAQRLDLFDRVADVARILDQGNAVTSHPDFASVLDQLDESIVFLEGHYDFSQAQAYLHQFEHLRNRACIAMRSALQRSLEKSLAQVEQQLRERATEGSIDTQVFYTRFRAAALNYKPLMSMLKKRVDVHETYSSTLEELEVFYAHLRLRLINAPVTAHLQSVLQTQLPTSQLASSTRQASTYILDVSHFERQCFEAYFELRQPQEPLANLQNTVGDIFYKALRPVVLSCDSVDSLREMADCLQLDILEPHQSSSRRADFASVLAVVFRLHKDVQEKLIFRVQTYIRDEIKGYQISMADLNYPAILYELQDSKLPATEGSDPQEVAMKEVARHQSGWFPPLERTLSILAKIYRALEMSTFQGLAQEAVDVCAERLKAASQALAQRQVPDPSDPLGMAVRSMDSQLFFIKQLLILREQVAAFECDLVATEKHFNFSNFWDALHLRLPHGLLGILKPSMQQSQVDSKKDIEAELKATCETLITDLTAHITQPLAGLLSEIGDYLARSGADRAKLKEQAFMEPQRLRKDVAAFLAHVGARVPIAASHIRLYLAAPGGSAFVGADAPVGAAAAQSTASILFRPVQLRLVDSWGRLGALFDEQGFDAPQLSAIGFIKPDMLRDLVSALFDGVMDAPWLELVQMVSKVPRMQHKDSPKLQPQPIAAVVQPEGSLPPLAVGSESGVAAVSATSPDPPLHPETFAPPPRVESVSAALAPAGGVVKAVAPGVPLSHNVPPAPSPPPPPAI